MKIWRNHALFRNNNNFDIDKSIEDLSEKHQENYLEVAIVSNDRRKVDYEK